MLPLTIDFDINNVDGNNFFHYAGSLEFNIQITCIMEDCYFFKISPTPNFKGLIKSWSFISTKAVVQQYIDKINQHQFDWNTDSIIRHPVGEVHFVDLEEKEKFSQIEPFIHNNLLYHWDQITLVALHNIDKIEHENFEPVYYKDECVFNSQKQCMFVHSSIEVTAYCGEHKDYRLFVDILLEMYKNKDPYKWKNIYETVYPTKEFLTEQLVYSKNSLYNLYEEHVCWYHLHSQFSHQFKQAFYIFEQLDIDYYTFLNFNRYNQHFLIGKTLLALDYPELIEFLFSEHCRLYREEFITTIHNKEKLTILWKHQQDEIKTYLLQREYEKKLVVKHKHTRQLNKI